ncbi:hypothetical protein F753_19190 [Stutzerimonas chloritidismutans AW-1]|uniref:Entry exclusion lipoprotein TrbK n=1 Tax=Stutzerimonas chloritidismutans AW-1 TaxID=1263865 RepID=V4Q4S8_STUCH|nr:hypothetical protein [Stutzerimonas chloritidismutans]ESQ97709.1 hypothetical protein F753_19190 [Stutzerimonas chloritidismutans AW-1]
MKKVMPFLCVLAITACGQSETPASLALPTVDELAAEPALLKDLRLQCKQDRVKLGDGLCSRVAEATRKRFYGDGQVPYTPSKEQPKF